MITAAPFAIVHYVTTASALSPQSLQILNVCSGRKPLFSGCFQQLMSNSDGCKNLPAALTAVV